MRAPSIDQVEDVLDSKVRGLLRADGGDVRVAKVGEDGTVHIRLVGRCAGCPGATYTISTLIEPVLIEEIESVKRVLLLPWAIDGDA